MASRYTSADILIKLKSDKALIIRLQNKIAIKDIEVRFFSRLPYA